MEVEHLEGSGSDTTYNESENDGDHKASDSEDSDIEHGMSLSEDDTDSDKESEAEADASKLKKKKKEGGFADVMSKILAKDTTNISTIILGKSKTDRDIALSRKQESNVPANIKQESDNLEKKEVDLDKVKLAKIKKRTWEEMGHAKPSLVFDREKERALQKIAMKGVVQLFNAVRKQQKNIETEMEKAGGSVKKREKVMENITKGKFMNVLKATADLCDDTPLRIKEEPEAVKEEPSWSILRDDFMMDTKMKDWDRDSDDEGETKVVPKPRVKQK